MQIHCPPQSHSKSCLVRTWGAFWTAPEAPCHPTLSYPPIQFAWSGAARRLTVMESCLRERGLARWAVPKLQGCHKAVKSSAVILILGRRGLVLLRLPLTRLDELSVAASGRLWCVVPSLVVTVGRKWSEQEEIMREHGKHECDHFSAHHHDKVVVIRTLMFSPMLQLDLAMKYLNDNYLIDCNKVLSQIFMTPRGWILMTVVVVCSLLFFLYCR